MESQNILPGTDVSKNECFLVSDCQEISILKSLKHSVTGMWMTKATTIIAPHVLCTGELKLYNSLCARTILPYSDRKSICKQNSPRSD